MKYKNFLLRAVNLLLILGVLWQYQQVALIRAAAVSQRKQEIAEVEATIRGRVFRGKTDLSAHRCRRGALCGQLHTFPAGAVRLHPAFRPFFLWVRLRLRQLGRCRLGAFRLIQKKLFHRKKQLRLPERAVLLGQKVKYLLLAWLVALYVTRQEKMLTGASRGRCFPA